MANQIAGISDAVGSLKINYQGTIVTQFNNAFPFYKEISKGSEKWNGQQVNRPVKVRRNQGIGATSDGGNLPAIGKQTVVQAIIGAKYNYLRFGITGPLIKASQGEKGAFVSAMSYNMEEGARDFEADMSRQFQWDGTSDLATVSANAVGSTVITVTGRESTEDGNKFLDVGMVIDIVDASGNYKASAVTITDLTGTTTATLTLSMAVTVAANDIVVRSGAYNQEIEGLRVPLDGATSSIWSINRATYPVFQGNVTNASGAQLTLDMMKQPWNDGRRRGGAKYDYIKTDFDTERFYEKLLTPDKRYIGKIKGDGTFANKDQNYLEYGGLPIVPDQHSPREVTYIDSSTWKKYVLSELEWADETGTHFIAQTGVDAFEVRLRFFANLFCERPSANARLYGYISP